MNTVISEIQERASEKGKTIIFPETSDERVLKAATFLADEGMCKVLVVGKEKTLRTQAAQQGIELSPKIHFKAVPSADLDEGLAEYLYERRKRKGVSLSEAKRQLQNPLYFAATLVATGKADGCVAGSVSTTAEVIRAAIHTIGIREGMNTVSSIFLMALKEGQTLTFADCGVVPYPDPPQLADIAIESARTHQLLTKEEPRVGMLSFSTKGSARHERAQQVTEALQIVREQVPELVIDGELQFDAAFVPEVADRKAPGSPLAGNANVFIFPNLDAGNIAYKITERLAGAGATGPIIQGLAKPMMDLSRGCRWQDIVNATCVAVEMSESS